MRFVLVSGPMFTVYCAGCSRCLKAGDIPLCIAGRNIQCDKVFRDVAPRNAGIDADTHYCEACAVRHKRTEVQRADIRELAMSAREVNRL